MAAEPPSPTTQEGHSTTKMRTGGVEGSSKYPFLSDPAFPTRLRGRVKPESYISAQRDMMDLKYEMCFF